MIMKVIPLGSEFSEDMDCPICHKKVEFKNTDISEFAKHYKK